MLIQSIMNVIYSTHFTTFDLYPHLIFSYSGLNILNQLSLFIYRPKFLGLTLKPSFNTEPRPCPLPLNVTKEKKKKARPDLARAP